MNTISSGDKVTSSICFKLSEEQEMIRQMTAEFADNEIKPFVAEWDREDHVPMEVLNKMYDLGLTNIGVPAEYGGLGLDNLTRYTVADELAQRDAGIATTIVASSLLATDPIMVAANHEQKKMVVWENDGGSDVCLLSYRARGRF